MVEESDSVARITVRVPVGARNDIYRWAEELGVRTGHFSSTALMIGARALRAQMELASQAGPNCDSCGVPLDRLDNPKFFDGFNNPVYMCGPCLHGEEAPYKIRKLIDTRGIK